MSKLSFRARALDASKPMPVYKAEEIPDLPDFAAINRAVPQMPTGMEKEEESEHHLQRALSAQQVYGTAESLVIPIPDIEANNAEYDKLYKGEFKPPKQYIHVQAFGMDQEIPDYDMDSEDEGWLNKQTKKMEVTAQQFEEMMDRLEKGSGQQVVTLPEAKLLLKEDDDLIIAVYDYWLNKKLRMQQSQSLIPTVKTEKRDGSTTNNPYVAFRRRTEKMQTRKNRKNDEVSYEKMLKLRRDLNRAVTLFEMIKRREKTKKELLQLTIEIVEKRYDVEDYNGELLAKAEAQKHTRPTYYPLNQFSVNREWNNREETGFIRKKREYKKRKHKQSQQPQNQPSVQLPQYHEVDILHTDTYSSEEDALSPLMSASDHEDENDPDGAYAFRRKSHCSYHAPILDGLGNWPWCSQEEGGFGDKKYRYSLTSLSAPRRCVGFARRRVGRGGRIIIDRAFSEWDDDLWDFDMSASVVDNGPQGELFSYIKDNKWSHFRPRTPTDEPQPAVKSLSSTPVPMEFDIESFQSHQEQLLQMQRLQQEQLLKQEALDLDASLNLEHSFSSQPTSRFTLDSATAKFAASAVRDSSQCTADLTTSKPENGAISSPMPTVVNMVTNGPVSNSKTLGLSTSPAATVLQLNFPINTSSKRDTKTTSPLAVSTPAKDVITVDPVTVPATKAITPEDLNVIKVAPTTNDSSNSMERENHEEKSMVQTKVDNQVFMEVT